MKTIWTIALTIVSAGALLAQNVTGTWQGTLQPPQGKALRAVIKVALDNDKLKATFYPNIDQGGQSIPASSFTKDGSNIKMTITAMNGTYEGKLSADGNSITGNWSQGGPSLPLNLAKATPETAWVIPDPPAPPVRMAANADPAFEVATIKPSDPNRPGKLFTVRGQEVITINTTISDILTMAYSLHPKEIVGAPSWVESDKFDLTGKPDVPGQPSVAQMKVMIQKLLADRLQLKFHREKKELNVYALTVVKGGPKFTKSERDPNSLPGLFFGPPPITLNVTNATMGEVASLLQGNVLDKPVIDQTGLSGRFEARSFPSAEFAPLNRIDPAAAQTRLLQWLQELGLKFEARKQMTEVLKIDHVAQPSGN